MRPDLRCKLHFLPGTVQLLQTLLFQLLHFLLIRSLFRLVLWLLHRFSLENGEIHTVIGLTINGKDACLP